MIALDITGQRAGSLVAVKFVGYKGRYRMWLCRCDCGTERTVYAGYMTKMANRKTGCRSCGLKAKAHVTHGDSRRGKGTRLHKLWTSMRYRCDNPGAKKYHLYGGKGIRVCDEWQTFVNFRDWALANGYDDSLSIDRVNSDWHYDPSNCEWVTLSENSRRANVGYWRSMTCNA